MFITGSYRNNTSLQFSPEISIPTTSSGVGKWHEKLFLLSPETPSLDETKVLSSEYYIEYNQFLYVLREITRFEQDVKDLISLIEVKYVAADDFAMSPSNNQICFSLCIYWTGDKMQIKKTVQKFEQMIIKKINGVNLTKYFEYNDRDLVIIYKERIRIFDHMIDISDPERKLQNDFYRRLIDSQETMEDL